jgi:hypothetical protein
MLVTADRGERPSWSGPRSAPRWRAARGTPDASREGSLSRQHARPGEPSEGPSFGIWPDSCDGARRQRARVTRSLRSSRADRLQAASFVQSLRFRQLHNRVPGGKSVSSTGQ